MYNTEIKEEIGFILAELKEKLPAIFNDEKVFEEILPQTHIGFQRILNRVDNDQYIQNIAWQVADIWAKAEDMGVELTDDDVNDVKTLIEENFDASIGVNWDTIEYGIEMVLKGK